MYLLDLNGDQMVKLGQELGGYFIITMAVLALGAHFTNKLVPVIGQVVRAQEHNAVQVGRLADSVNRFTERDDRRIVRLNSLVAYCARQVKGNSEALGRIENTLHGEQTVS